MTLQTRWLLPVAALLVAAGLIGASFAVAADDELPQRAVAPGLAKSPPEPTPTPTEIPGPYVGDIASVYLDSAGIYGDDPLERGGTHYDGSGEVLDDPSAPHYIMWYPSLQGYGPPSPGFGGGNTVMAAHINYINYGNGPFASLLSADIGDTLYVTMDNGDTYAYTVNSVDLYSVDEIEDYLDDIMYPFLASNAERITLISCGGDFVPRPGGGGDYLGRVVVRADRYMP